MAVRKIAKSKRRKKPRSLEGPIQKVCLQYLKWAGWLAWRNNNMGVFDPIRKIYLKPKGEFALNGVSDAIAVKFICGQNVVAFFEFKSEKGKQTKDQIQFEKNIKARNGFYFVIRSVEELKGALKEIERFLKNCLESRC